MGTVLLNRRTGGWVLLLVAGTVGVLHIFAEPLNRISADGLHVPVPTTGLVIPIILVLAGVVLLQKSRKNS
jgi:hypothetical protein